MWVKECSFSREKERKKKMLREIINGVKKKEKVFGLTLSVTSLYNGSYLSHVTIWWCWKITSKPHLHTRNNTYATKREDLTKSTGVVSVKFPPKVKLELFTTLECQSWINYTYLGYWRFWGFYSSRRFGLSFLV